MKKTISISIAGIVFNVEEDAYQQLQDYLNHLHKIFDKTEGGGEIMEDIEIRIAELFNKSLRPGMEVISANNIDEIINVLGKPEDYQTASDFDDDEDIAKARKTQRKETQSNHSRTRNKDRKVFRDADDKVIAGVCSGIAYYFDWDVTWTRLGVVASLFILGPFTVFTYIILWMVFPKAITTTEQLQMRGQKANIENIKKKVDESFEEVKESVNKVRNNPGFQEFIDSVFHFFGRFFTFVGNAFRWLFRVFGKVIGIVAGLFFLVIAVAIVFSLISTSVFSDVFVINSAIISPELISQVFLHGETSLTMLIIGGLLVVVPSLFLLFYLAFYLLFNVRQKIKGLGFMVFISMLIGATMLTVVGVRNAVAFSNQTELADQLYFSEDNLHISIMEDLYFDSRISHYSSENLDLISIEGDSIVLGYPIQLDFVTTDKDVFRIETEKSSGGVSKMDAIDNIERISFPFGLEDNTLSFSPNIIIPKVDKYHGQEVEITIYIPEGKTVTVGENIDRINFRDWRKCSDGYHDRNCNGETFTNDRGVVVTLNQMKEDEQKMLEDKEENE